MGPVGSAPFLEGGGSGGVMAGCDVQLSAQGREPGEPQTAAATTHPFQVTDTLPFLDEGSLGHRCVTHTFLTGPLLPRRGD